MFDVDVIESGGAHRVEELVELHQWYLRGLARLLGVAPPSATRLAARLAALFVGGVAVLYPPYRRIR